MNEAIFNHEPYRIKEVESNDYGFEDDGGMYHMVTVETEFVDAWGRDITLIAFLEEHHGKMWPSLITIGYRSSVWYD